MGRPFKFETEASEAADVLHDNIVGKTVLITGVSLGGIGAESALVIAAHSPKLLILAGRDPEKAQAITSAIHAKHPEVKCRALHLDLASFASVRKAGADVNSWTDVTLDVLMNNAAVMAVDQYVKTVDGFELQLQTNHLGHFLFTNLIKYKLALRARVVNVSSVGHTQGDVEFENYNFYKDGVEGAAYDRYEAYYRSKSANCLFSLELARRGVLSFSLNPGAIATNLTRHMTAEELALRIKQFREELAWEAKFKTLGQGAATQIVAAFDPEIESQSGAYLDDCAITMDHAAPYVKDTERAKQLWKWSEKLVGQEFIW